VAINIARDKINVMTFCFSAFAFLLKISGLYFYFCSNRVFF
jgi:hypothetical protein